MSALTASIPSADGAGSAPAAIKAATGAKNLNTNRAAHLAPRTRRNTELALLVLAVALVLFALTLLEVNQHRPYAGELARAALIYSAMAGGTHLAIRFFAPYADPLLFPVVALLNGLGMVVIYRIGLEERDPGNEAVPSFLSFGVNPQLLWTLCSMAAFALVLAFLNDYRVLSRYGYTFGALGVLFLAIPVFMPAVNGSNVWIRLGFLTIQPGEFAKIALIICSASLLVAKRDLFTSAGKHVMGMDLPRMRDLGPLLAAWFLAVLTLVLQNDLGMSLLIFVTSLLMLYVATERLSWLLIGIALLTVGSVIAYQLVPHVRVRVQTWWDPFVDYNNTGYQLSEALFGLGAGGLAGTGLGAGSPARTPEAHNDFILASVGEELGLIGLAGVILLYFLLAARGLRTALTVRDSFGKLLAAGLSLTLALQVFVIAGGVTDLIPLTGLTTPFMSAGGSSLLSNYILLALLVKISHETRKPGSLPAAPGSGGGKAPSGWRATRHAASKGAAQDLADETSQTSHTAQIPKVPAAAEEAAQPQGGEQ